MSKLIFIDGPPGVGKSTLATALSAALPGYRLLHEMDPDHPLHPVAVGSVGADFGELRNMEVSELADLLINKWTDFLHQAEAEEQDFILESYPYQSHLRVLWQMNAPESILNDWLSRLHEALRQHEPFLVMLRYTGSDDRVTQIYDQRGPEWMKFIIDFVRATPYGLENGLEGRAGAITFLKAYNNAITGWCNQWPFEKVVFEAWSLSPDVQAAEIVRSLA